VGQPAGPGGRARPDHGGVDPDLIRRAKAAGIAPEYENWRHELVQVPPETLEALLGALDRAAALGHGAAAESEASPDAGTSPAEIREIRERDAGLAIPELPPRRAWGFTVQLYSVRSRQSWGHGDLHDLADLAAWSGRDLDAGFILLNPLSAAEPLPSVSASPYLPMTRLFTSPLYLRVEDIPEYTVLPVTDRITIEQLAAPLQARNTTADLIDRDAVWSAKLAALELIRQVPLDPARQAEFDQYRAERGAELEHWSAWCALAEAHGPDWRTWPAQCATLTAGLAAVREDPGLAERAAFHSWLQWHCDEQLAAAERAADAAGLQHGIIHDLPVGVHPGGADAWAHPELLVAGVNVGAPPDEFNQLGQDWGLPPWHPQQLAAAGYRPLANLFAASLRHAGGLRVDHVLGLTRLWWVPAGQPPDRGAYVSYDLGASVGALAGTAAQAGAVAIGEDLGTVDPVIQGYLARHHILGTTMAWFAREPDGTPLRPGHWRRTAMATVGTHDVPPVAGFVTGDQVTVRARLGLLDQPLEWERVESERNVARWRAALEDEGLLRRGGPHPGAAEFTIAMYGFLSRTPSLLIGVSLADAVGDVRTQNVPGTSAQYPNWQIPLCDAEGRAVLAEELPGLPLLRDTVAAARGASPRRGWPARQPGAGETAGQNAW
jgi:4-alpha-glucanotransferase